VRGGQLTSRRSRTTTERGGAATRRASLLLNCGPGLFRLQPDFAECGFVLREILRQYVRERFSLLWTKEDALEILNIYSVRSGLRKCSERQEEIPQTDAHLHTIGVGFPIVGCVGQLEFRGLLRVHRSSEYNLSFMKALLFDMDGVVYNSETLIPGAPETLAWVREHDIPHMFVTNTTSRGRGVLMEKLQEFGITATEEDILTPCIAAREYILAKDFPGSIALFVPPKTRGEFMGLNLLPEGAEDGADYVVVGDLGEAWSFQKLNCAFRLLQSAPNVELIALGMTRFWQAEDGLRLDTAPFVAALECATGHSPTIMGKPAAAFFNAAAKKLSVQASDIWMVGDDVRVDIGGAQDAGLKGVLVRTGKYRAGDLGGDVTPDYVIDSIATLPALF